MLQEEAQPQAMLPTQEYLVLVRELGKVQSRLTLELTQKQAEVERLRADLFRLRAKSVIKDSEIAFLKQDLLGIAKLSSENGPLMLAKVLQRQHAWDVRMTEADRVICQTGCISHNNYWRDDDFCKRTRKQCVHAESSAIPMDSLQSPAAANTLSVSDAILAESLWRFLQSTS